MQPSLIQESLHQDEITILKLTKEGDFYFIHEKLLTVSHHTCEKDQEPLFYRLPAKYPSIELTPTYLLIGLFILILAFLIGKKWEKHQRKEEIKIRKKKKLERKKYYSNEQYIEERAKYFFFKTYPNLAFKDDSLKISHKISSADCSFENNIEPFKSLESNQDLNPNLINSLVCYNPVNKKEEGENSIAKSLVLSSKEAKMEQTFILNWPLLDQKFSLNVDFTLQIEEGVIKSLTTSHNLTKEAFQRLISVLIEKYGVLFPNSQKTQKTEFIFLNEMTKEILPLENESKTLKENKNEENFKSDSEKHSKSLSSRNSSPKKQISNSIIPFLDRKGHFLRITETIENEKTQLEGIKHFQFDLFENGRFNKVFTSLQEIGKGGFGEVYKAMHKIEDSVYAIKKVYLPLKINEDVRNHKYFREVMLMTKFNHKNVIRYYTSWIEEPDINFKEYYLKRQKKKMSKKNKIKKKRSNSSKSSKENVSYVEEEKNELGLNISNYERTHLSSLGFEWASNHQNNEISIKKNEISSRKLKKKAFKHKISQSKSNSVSSLPASNYTEYEENHKDAKVKASRNTENHWSSIIDQMTIDKIPVVLYIQMHFCSGRSLRNYLDSSERKINRIKNFQMFLQMIEGIKCIHSNGIIHRDLKPANIFIDQDNTIMIGDFGLSVLQGLNLKQKSSNLSLDLEEQSPKCSDFEINLRQARSLTKNIGTPLYLAPEQEKGENYDEKVDIYALGLILFEMFTKINTEHERLNMFNDIRKNHKIPEALQKNYKFEANLITLMISSNPKDRPSSEQIENCKEFLMWRRDIVEKKSD